MEIITAKRFKPGFHVVVSVVSVLSKNCKDRYNHMETSHTTAQYDRYEIRQIQRVVWIEMILSPTTDTTGNGFDTTAFCKWNHRKQLIRCNKNVSQNALPSAAVTAEEATDTTNTTIWKSKILNCRMSCVCAAGACFTWQTRQIRQIQLYGNQVLVGSALTSKTATVEH